ncbi:hemerythrin domain-containing protein [Janibacter sp. DB-40]|uniref:hemerythrin domain-containing protein n=1 Tax=Janibacter sp. DB-40 TaxID=3028808 RepID=UPI002405FA7C|nr:hemerythrin domain-containing protein [Janibacter sp. DB-40]
MTSYSIPRPTAGDITDLIAADHRLLEDLMRDMRDSEADRDAARAAFSDLLVAHSEAEEETVYPHLKSKKVIDGEEQEHGDKEHAATNEALLHLLQAKGTDTQKFEDALEEVAEVLNHHIGEEELSILNPAKEDASQDLRESLAEAWTSKRNSLLDSGCGTLESVEKIVKKAYDDGLLPNDEQPEG